MGNDLIVPSIGWIILTVASVVLVLIGIRAGLRRMDWPMAKQKLVFSRTIIVIISWIAVLLLLSFKGLFIDFTHLPPRPAFVVILPLPFFIMIAYAGKTKNLLQAIPPHWIIFMQSFRIAVELLLLLAFVKGKLPVQMTFEGRNFDIVTGVLALPVGYLVARKGYAAKRLALLFNIAGLLLLLNVLVIAVRSMPSPMRIFMNEPTTALVGQFPFILLPGILVPIAYGLHIFSLRQLALQAPASDKQIKNDGLLIHRVQ